MDKTLEFKIDHVKKIIYETFRGKIELKDIAETQKAKLSSPDFNPTYSYITDIRGASFSFNDFEREAMYKAFKGISHIKNINKRCAIITSNPQEVVYSEMFQKKIGEFSAMKFKTFSTENAAYHWIKEIE